MVSLQNSYSWYLWVWDATLSVNDICSQSDTAQAQFGRRQNIRTQNSDIHLFDINYKYIISLHKKNNMY